MEDSGSSNDEDGWDSVLQSIVEESTQSQSAEDLPAPVAVLATRGSRGRPLGFMSKTSAPASNAIEHVSKNSSSSKLAIPKPTHQSALDRFGPISSLTFVGTDLQKRYKQVLARALEKKVDYADPLIAGLFNHLQTSASVLAKFFEATNDRVHSKLLEAGVATVHGGGWLTGSLLCCIEEMIKQGLWKPIMMVRRLRYDETPTRIRLPNESTDSTTNLPGLEREGKLAPDVVEHAKVLQTEFQIYCLLKDVSASEHLLIKTNVPTTLQAVDRTTAECTKACVDATMSRVCEFRRISQLFPFRVNHATTDKFSANLKTEKAFKSEDPNWIKHHVFCSVHRVATSITAANSLFRGDTAGVLSIALATREVGAAKRLRSILQGIFKERLIIKHVMPNEAPHLIKYRSQVYDVFLPLHGAMKYQNMKRRFILNHFLNGNLENSCEIEHYCPFNHCIDDDEVHKCFATYVAWALIPTKVPKYSRGRWTGWDKALQWTGLLASHHSLLSELILRYTNTKKLQVCPSVKPRLEMQPLPSHLSADAEPQSEDDTWGAVAADILQSVNPVPAPQAAQTPAGTDEPADKPDGEDSDVGSDKNIDLAGGQAGEGALPELKEFSWVEYNKQQKAKASAYVQTDHCASLAILMQVVEHFLVVMHHFLKMSGDEWDLQQQSLSNQGQKRGYRLLDCTQAVAVKRCFDDLVGLLQGIPKALPHLSHTREKRNWFFRLISKGACAFHQVVRLPHFSFPFKLFLALEQGWGAISSEPSCLHDELTAHFVSHFSKEENIADGNAALEALGICSHCDIAQVECRHATNRDFTMLRGRGWRPNLEVVSAKFVCGTFKAIKTSHERRIKKKVKKDAQKKVHRPGGAWRAFLSQRLRGQRPIVDGSASHTGEKTMKDYSEEYASLTQEEKAYFLEVGRLATIAGRAGYIPFGRPEKNKAKTKCLNDLQRVSIVPGTITSTGAIVMSDGNPDLALVHSAERPFSELFRDYSTQVVALRQRHVDPSTPNTECPSVAKMVSAVGCTAQGNSFETLSMSRDEISRASRVNHYVKWKPPVEEFAQARFEIFSHTTSHTGVFNC